MNYLQLLLLSIFSMFNNDTPVRLNKPLTLSEKINIWTEKNFYLLCFIAIVGCLIIFCIVCFIVVGASAVESGNMYNHIQDVI